MWDAGAMFPLRVIFLGVCLALCERLAVAQTVINSTFLDRPQWPPVYSDPNNWAPNGVPNNTADRHHNVTINSSYFVMVDTNATISNLTLGSSLPGLIIDGRNLTVIGTTDNQREWGYITVQSYEAGGAVKFDAGTLTTFSNHVLSGEYTIAGFSNPATLQFNGAHISTLANGSVTMLGALTAITDESGNDALRSLARIDVTGALRLYGRSVVTNAPFQNDGTLLVYNGATPITFLAAAGLGNFDSSTRTLTGGVFEVIGSGSGPPVELRFPGADVVNLASSIQLQGSTARVADLAGNDSLRNLAHILPAGKLWLLNHSRTIGGTFRNDGVLSVDDHAVCAISALANFDASTSTLSGGTFSIGSGSQLKFAGADIVHNGASITLSGGSTIEDLTGADGLRNFNDNLPQGKFVAGNNYQFTAPSDFMNAGWIETAPMIFQTRQIIPEGRFIVPSGFRYTQTGGSTVNNGWLVADDVELLGGTFSGGGTVHGDVTVQEATYSPSAQTVIQGNLTLNPDSHFRYQLDFGDPKAVTGKVVLAGTLEVDIPSDRFIGSTQSFTILNSATPLTGVFSNAPNGARIPTADGKGSVTVHYESKRVWVWQYRPEPPPAQLLNISSRASLAPNANDPSGDRTVLIGGFIITNFSANKDLVLRGLGPSLAKFGVEPVLADPVIELRSASGALLASNNDWQETQASEISGSGLAPENQREAALRITLQAGSYTVVLKEKNGLGGNGLVEIYDLSESSTTKLANISTRGYTDASNVLIGGIIAAGAGQANAEVVVRALGPHLTQNGILNALDDPTLEVRDPNGGLLAFNDDWSTNSDQLVSTGLTPSEKAESAIRLSLPRGNYTAIVRAKGNSGGVALVEFYDLRH